MIWQQCFREQFLFGVISDVLTTCLWPYLELLFQLLSQGVELVQAFAEINVAVELDEGLDKIRHAPFCFDLVTAVGG